SFTLHRDLVCDRSSHFRAALLGQFEEASTGIIEFPDLEDSVFKMFILWIYGSHIEKLSSHDDLNRCIALMCFARTILLEELHNDCMDTIRKYFRARTSVKANPPVTAIHICLAYHTVPELPTLRLFVCLEAALHMRFKSMKELTNGTDGGIFHQVEQGGDFAVDFTKMLVYQSKGYHQYVAAGKTISKAYDCMFHNHSTSDTCQYAGKATNDDVTALIVGAIRYLAKEQTSETES
ncbi:MAG: hypothetical protein Q9204_008866, partial [Flavoplaca sp. TL-2023a]